MARELRLPEVHELIPCMEIIFDSSAGQESPLPNLNLERHAKIKISSRIGLNRVYAQGNSSIICHTPPACPRAAWFERFMSTHLCAFI